jgi:hypothetical protein
MICTSEKHKKLEQGSARMSRGKRYQPEQLANLLRQVKLELRAQDATDND